MYEQVKTVIKSGRFELRDMLRKIDTLWLQNDFTDEKRDELANMARANADMDKGYTPVEERVVALEEKFITLEAAFREHLLAGVENPDMGEVVAEYPEWVQPTHNENAYRTGAKITYKGKRYECIAPEGYPVTYPPDVLTNMWKLVEG